VKSIWKKVTFEVETSAQSDCGRPLVILVQTKQCKLLWTGNHVCLLFDDNSNRQAKQKQGLFWA